MSVIIKIDHCDQCPYVGHSGSFTPGGAKPICDHLDSVDAVVNHLKETRNKILKGDYKYDWKHRVLKKDDHGNLIVPEWCPLKEGS